MDASACEGLTQGTAYEVQDVEGGHIKIHGRWFLESRFNQVDSRDTEPLRKQKYYHVFTDVENREIIEIEVPEIEVAQALRYNEGKGEHDYLLTYPGGIDAVFGEDFDYYETLDTLALWYRDETSTDHIINDLRNDAEAAGHDLASALAETNARGAAKYAAYNYLKGANYRQYCQSAIRHAIELQKGETHDAEGNNHLGALVFNLLMLDACVAWGIGTDDRPPQEAYAYKKKWFDQSDADCGKRAGRRRKGLEK